jgi:hypothetical protein
MQQNITNSCFTSGTRRVSLVENVVISINTKSGRNFIWSWEFMTNNLNWDIWYSMRDGFDQIRSFHHISTEAAIMIFFLFCSPFLTYLRECDCDNFICHIFSIYLSDLEYLIYSKLKHVSHTRITHPVWYPLLTKRGISMRKTSMVIHFSISKRSCHPWWQVHNRWK